MEKENKYNMTIKISPQKHYIECGGDIELYFDEEKEVVSFYLYKNLQVNFIQCSKDIRYKITDENPKILPDLLETEKVTIYFKEKVLAGQCISINLKYEGYIDIATEYEVNRVTKEFVELGIYTPWFPFSEDIDCAKFKVSVDIDSRYKVINSKKVGDKQIIKQEDQFLDCTIIASDEFKNFKNSVYGIDIIVFYISDNHKKIAERLSEDCKNILKFYQVFGEVKEDISIVILPRSNGGGYCRKGLIVLDDSIDLQDEVEAYRFLAHELAHLWWNKAKSCTSWEDWLNESFAEFSALLSLRENFGEEVFIRKMKQYSEESRNLIAIKNSERNNKNAYKLLYRKGPVILNELREYIGEIKMKEFLQRFYVSTCERTKEVLDILENVAGVEGKEKLQELLVK